MLTKKILIPSRIANCIILISILWTIFNNRFWRDEGRIISWDIISYYAYLPATFIYDDVTLKFTDNYKGPHKFVFWPSPAPNGGKVIKTSMGLSFLYAPFFFMGHLAANILHYDTGGYSPPYKFFLIMGTVFYLMIGLYFLRKILERYFNQWITAITLLATVIGTNLFYFSSIEPTMSHAYNFMLFVLFLYCTIKWYKKQTLGITIALGLLAGIISLVRPSNFLVALVFLLYGITSLKDIKNRGFLYIANYWKILLIIFLAFLVWVPQMLYWKKVTGQWLFFSYGDEGFFFNHPQIIKGLFGFRKGWFVYTPIMLFAIAGIPLLFKRLKEYSWLIIIFLSINTYVILSWWAWWYGGCFGCRPIIDFYGLLAIPMALSIQWIFERRKFLKYFLFLLLFSCFIKGIHHTIQYYYGAIHWDAMTRQAYFDSFWRVRPSEKFNSLLAHPDYEKAKKGIQAIEKQ